jgi:hypothetical protein
VATQITTATHQDSLSGSTEKRIDVAPDGVMWGLIVQSGKARFFSSSNGGTTWAVSAASDLGLGSGQDTAVPSFMIDADGYAHVCFARWQADPQVIIYARGTPRSGGGWSWSTKTIAPASGRTGVDTDLVVFRYGTGWVAWISYDLGSSSSGVRVAKVSISASGALTVDATEHGPASGGASYQIGLLEFAHTGDGKTPVASPDVFLVTARQATSGTILGQKAAHSGGVWTWGTPVTIAYGVQVPDTVLTGIWDGDDRMMVAWATGSTSVSVSEWNTSTGTITARNPGALPGGSGTVLGISMAHDPATDDVYLLAYGGTIGNIIVNKFTRTSATWGGWTTVATRAASAGDGDVQAVRHPPRDSVDALYSVGSGPYTIYGTQVTALTRSPNAPTLIYPPNGARVDLASGATFTWEYKQVSPGDTQQAYRLRRVYGATTEYWNAGSSNWQSGSVFNASASARAEFPAGKWTTGTTYTWSVETRSSTGADSGWATDRTVIASTAPQVTVTAPSGLSFGETTPLVQWTYTSTKSQRDFQVRIVATFGVTIDPNDPLPAVYDSGVVGSSIARAVRVTTSLTNDTSYRAYVRCTDTDGVASAWNYSDFTVSVQPPSGPVVEVIEDLNIDTGVLRARLDLIARSNYLTALQATGQATWSAVANCTLAAQADDPANQLLPSLKMTSVGAGNMTARTSAGSPPEAPIGQPALTRPLSFPVVENTPYTAIASFKAAATARAALVKIEWYDDDDGTGTLLSTSSANQVTAGTVAYTQATVTAVAPLGAKLARVVVEVLGATAAAEVVYAARISLHPGRDTAWQPGGYSGTQTLRVERSVDGGTTWTTFIDRVKPDFYQHVVQYDRTIPFGLEVQYRCYTDVDPGSGALLSSAASPTSTVVVHGMLWAIRDPADDLAEVQAYVIDYSRHDAETIAIARVAGRTYPVVDSEGIQSGEGKLRLYVPASLQAATFDVITRSVPTIVQSPAGLVFLARFPAREYASADVRARTVDIDFVEVEED